MCKVMEDMREKARKEEHIKTQLANIKSLMESLKLPAEKVMDALKIPNSEPPQYTSMLQ